MLEKIKKDLSKKYDLKSSSNVVSKKNIAVGMTIILALVTGICVSSYEPGQIDFLSKSDSNKKVVLPELSKSTGPKQGVEMETPNIYGKKVLSKNIKPNLSNNPTLPASAFSNPNDFFNKLPTTMPSFSPPSSTGLSPSTLGNQMSNKFDVNMVYAHHVLITDHIKGSLNDSFSLISLSDAPKDGTEKKFTTTYEINDNGNIFEKFELMSVVRNSSMSSIKTATDALNSLVEEHDSVNIIESTDSYLIYDFAGNKGFQIGKITVDDQGIYILGYINLTTNNMPTTLVNQWVDSIRDM